MLHLMPATNPRLTITVTPSVASVLRTLSAITGNSQSAILGELLEANLPIFERMVRVLEAARKVKDDHRQKVAENLEEAQGRLEQQLGLVLAEFDGAAKPVLDAAERIERRAGRAEGGAASSARAAGRGARRTPMSNRGVTPRPTGKKTGHRGR